MPAEQQVHYLSATLVVRSWPTNERNEADGSAVIGHFYVLAADGTQAGAVACDVCRARNVQFLDYLCLPVALKEHQLIPSDEHRIAYGEAVRRGVGIVLATVTGGDLDPIDVRPWTT